MKLSIVRAPWLRSWFACTLGSGAPTPSGAIAYDPEERVLFLSRSILSANIPNPLRVAASYWPFYEQEAAREKFPVIAKIDDALWNAYLQAAATARGVAWNAENCRSVYVEKRLPCEWSHPQAPE